MRQAFFAGPAPASVFEIFARGTCTLALCCWLAACGGGGGSSSVAVVVPPVQPAGGVAWQGFAGDAQHAAQAGVATQALARIRWRTAVDLAPQNSGGGPLLTHYGSPVISAKNTVIVPVKTSASGNFRIDAHAGDSGNLLWTAASDYLLPSIAAWTPSYNLTLTPANRLYAPGAGGKLLIRDDADTAAGNLRTVAFFGDSVYAAAAAVYDAQVFINTPLTSDAQGNIYFGFMVTGANPAGLTSGIARVTANGGGTWVSVATASGDATMTKPAINSAPALSPDQKTVYMAVSGGGANGRPTGYLLALDSSTLAARAKVSLIDPLTGQLAWINDNASSSPTVGPDGDVYFGVLESNAPAHNFRGWLLHFNAALSQGRTAGSFGWDDTASIVPAAMVPSYSGTSSYLLMSKYNNYGGAGSGDGRNRIAILDPNQSQADTISGNAVMKEVLTILGPTPDAGYPGGVTEWCINTAAVDPFTKSVIANSEDGYLYRWDLTTNQLSERIQLTSGIGESYTPTAVGADGAVYAINNAVLFSVGR